jgi:heme-degrading monooxygenase HmoA
MAHLAQVNIAIPREPLDSALLADFVAALEPINASADAAEGFVWRMQDEGGDATGIRGFGDDRLIINVTVWESLDALRDFVYQDPAHRAALRRRREWFERIKLAVVLWWIPEGHIPTVAEAEERMAHLEAHGPTEHAFTFARALCPA